MTLLSRRFVRGDNVCEITWAEREAEVSTSREGKRPRSKEHSFASADDCREFVAQQAKTLLGQGWMETEPSSLVARHRDVSVDAHLREEARPFLETCRADPDADGPRLVYADWLLEREDRLGELINIQCALEATRAGVSSPSSVTPRGAQLTSLREREQRLFAQHRARWEGELSAFLRSFQWIRGFVDDVHASAASLVSARATDALARAPLVRRLCLAIHSGTPTKQRIFDTPLLETVSALTVELYSDSNADWLALGAGSAVSRVRQLTITKSRVSPIAVEAMSSSAFAATLESVEASFTDEGLRALATSSLQPTSVTFSSAPDPAALERFYRSSAAARIRRVVHAGGPFDGEATQALAAVSAKLESLRFISAEMTASAVRHLALSAWPERALELGFPDNLIGDDGVEVLAARLGTSSPLRVLDLTGCDVTSRGVFALAASGGLDNLVQLVLDRNRIDPQAVRALADPSCLPALRTVSVAKNRGASISDLRAAASGGKIILAG